MEKGLSCCFTGHRDSKLPWQGREDDPRCLRLKERIYDTAEALYRAGIRHYICGMATGCDFYFCEAVLKLRAEHPEISLEAAIPFENQSAAWNDRQRRRYDRLTVECDYHTVIQKEYSAGCYMRRNKYMVDSSSVLVSAFNGKSGGTMNTLLYAMREGLEIIQLPIDE